MRNLSCKRTTALLSLYAAGDLAEERAREVASHVATCEGCRALAAELDASRALLAEACEPPQFGEEFYAGIRGAVLTEIARGRRGTPSKPSLVAWLLPARRLVLASTFALLLFASFVALRRFSRAANETHAGTEQTAQLIERAPRQTNAAARADAPTTHVDATTTTRRTLSQNDAATNSQADATTKQRSAARVRAGSPTRSALIRDDGAKGEPRAFEPSRRAATSIREGSGAEVAAVAGETLNPARGSTVDPARASAAYEAAGTAEGAGEVSRIEIQTADPNIRIIWLAPAKPEPPTRDRDQHENGDRD